MCRGGISRAHLSSGWTPCILVTPSSPQVVITITSTSTRVTMVPISVTITGTLASSSEISSEDQSIFHEMRLSFVHGKMLCSHYCSVSLLRLQLCCVPSDVYSVCVAGGSRVCQGAGSGGDTRTPTIGRYAELQRYLRPQRNMVTFTAHCWHPGYIHSGFY